MYHLRTHNVYTFSLVGSLLCALATAAILYLPQRYPLPALEISAAVFGLIIGFIIRATPKVSRRSFLTVWGLSAATYFGIAMVIEIAKYQPWRQLPLDGHLVDLFSLRAVYNSSLVLLYIFVSICATALPVLFSHHVWRHYQPGGDRNVGSGHSAQH